MIRTRQRRVVLLAIMALVLASLLDHSRGLFGETEAAWSDPVRANAQFKSGSWASSGYGRGVSSSVVGTLPGINILSAGTPYPWEGMQGLRSEEDAGSERRTNAGPYSSSGLASVNGATLANASGNGPVVGAACGSYSVGSPDTPCVSGSTASASASITSQRLRVALSIATLGVVGTNVVSIDSTASAPALSASVSCNLNAQSSSAVAPSAAGNFVLVGNRRVPIPNSNTSSAPIAFSDGLLNLARYTNVQLHRFVTPGSQSASAQSYLRLTGNVSVLSLLGAPLLATSFDLMLVSAECGPGTAPSFPPSVAAAASHLAVQQASPVGAEPAPSSAAQVTTTESAKAMPDGTESPSATEGGEVVETTNDESVPTPQPEQSSTTDAPPTDETPEQNLVDVPEQTPVETPPLAQEESAEIEPSAVESPPTTTEPVSPATVFTGSAGGNVESLTFADDVVCTASEEADYTGTVQFGCDDGTVFGVDGSVLAPEAVAAATVDGVWTPVLIEGAAARPVLAAVLR